MKSFFTPHLALGFLFVCLEARAIELISAQTRGNSNALTVTFSADVTEASATNAANYSVNNGVNVSNVMMLESSKVRIFTSLIAEGQVYVLTVNEVQDRAVPPATILPDSRIVFLQTQGIIARKEFDNIGGTLVSDLTNNVKFPSQPDGVGYLTSLEAPSDIGDNYGQQVLGFVTAPLTGDYTFYIASDDQSVLFLSSDANPANKQMIASEPGYNASRLWIGDLNERLQIPTNFVAGDYIVEAEDFDYGGGQHILAADTMPYLGGAYAGLSAVAEVDYHDPGVNENVAYRAGDQGVAMWPNADLNRGSFTTSTNFQIGYNDPGDWYNYTRAFPTLGQDYYVLAHLASGGADMAAQLDAVTAGAGTTSQTTSKLGEFHAPATGSWDLFTFVPLLDANSNLVIAHLEGQTTLRFTVLPGALDFDYVAFKPTASGPPDLSQLRPRNVSAAIHLEAGGKYYLEALMKEGGGDDHVAVTWRKPGEPEPTNGAAPISGEFLSTLDPLVPASIDQQPAGQTINEFGSATFAVALSGTPPYDFQWFRNGVMIPGANGPAYTFGPVAPADDGTVFSARAGNGIGSLVSSNAVLTVIADTTPPVLVAAEGSPTFDRITVHFSESINAADAGNLANYAINRGLTLLGASPNPDGQSVLLLTSSQTTGVRYSVTVNGIHDVAAAQNKIVLDSQVSFTAFVPTPGFLRREVYLNISGATLSDLTNNPAFPDWPDSVNFVTSFESSTTYLSNYGVRLSGLLVPPTTGDYVFYLNSDDQGALFLSTDDDPSHKVQVAFEPQWNGPRQWITGANQASRGNPPANISAPTHLESGGRYYIEALMKQGGGADNLAVAWQLPGGPPVQNFDPPISGTYLAAYANPDGAVLTITGQPQNVVVSERQTASFSIQVSGASAGVSYQWQREGVDIPNANSPRYETLPLALADNGSHYRCLAGVPGLRVASTQVTLGVTADTTPPTVVSLEGNLNLNRITLHFSEPINPTDATNLASYAFSGGLMATNVVLGTDQTTVVLYTTPQITGSNYVVSVTGIHDTATIPNVGSPGSQSSFFAWVPEEFVGPFPSWADVKRDFGAVGDGLVDDTTALQNALNALGNVNYRVLYVPAGTYRITQGLTFNHRNAVSVLGEDPSTTTIKWDGPTAGVMLFCNGISLCRFGRLTWDGNSRALTGIEENWDGQGSSGSTDDYVDSIFQDLGFGIYVGRPDFQDDEGSVLRCQFLRCSQAGIGINSLNAIDWHIWYSRFQDCKVGVDSFRGSFHVHNSIFRYSTEADLEQNGSYCSFRHNYSIGSRAFYVVGFTGNALPVTLQANVILDSQTTPVQINSYGPLLMLDNVIRNAAGTSNPVVVAGGSTEVISVGNTFTTAIALTGGGRVLELDDTLADPSTINPEEPELPGFLPNFHRTTIEVPAGASADVIQAAINSAALLGGQRPVVHLPAGTYYINRTLTVPPGVDLQLVGDGYNYFTILNWIGADSGPVLRLDGPSHATLRDLDMRGNTGQADGIAVDNCDQPGARVFLERVGIGGWKQNGLWVDGLDHADVELRELNHGNSYSQTYGSAPTDDQVSVKVVGGPLLASAQSAEGRVNMFSGGSAGDCCSYNVDSGGRLLVWDTWFEGPAQRFMRLTGSGTFTLHGASIALYNPVTNDVVDLENFRGQASFLDTAFIQSNLRVAGLGDQMKVLALGSQGFSLGGAATFCSDDSPEAQVAVLNSWVSNDSNPVIHPITDFRAGGVDDQFLRQMLSQTRNERPQLPMPMPAEITDVRLYRVSVQGARVGLHLYRGELEAQTQPQDQVVRELQDAVFSIEVTGVLPSFQWFMNGQPVFAGTNQTLTLPSVPLSDNGARLYVVVSNALGTITSTNVTLTVLPDLAPPQLVSAVGLGDPVSQIEVTFSVPMDYSSATNVSNYLISNGVLIYSAAPETARNMVLLSTSAFDLQGTYTLTVSGLRDASANHNLLASTNQDILLPPPLQISLDPASLVPGQIIDQDSLSPDWFNAPDTIGQGAQWTTLPVNYLVAVDPNDFVLESRVSARDMELDTWTHSGVVYLRLGEDGAAIYFAIDGSSSGSFAIGIVTGAGQNDYWQGTWHSLYQNQNLLGTVPSYRSFPTDGDYFTCGVQGFDIYARYNGQEFVRIKEYRHMQAGHAAIKTSPNGPFANGHGTGIRQTALRYYQSPMKLFSDYQNFMLDLRDFGLRDLLVQGSITAGSNLLRLNEAPSPPFKVGAWVIIETGAEPGQGSRGTVGVGGVWPALHYSNASARDADVSQPVNTYCWLDSDGSVRQWDGSAWQDRAHFQNEVGTISEDYFVAKAVPKALRAVVQAVSGDGLLLTLDEAAQATVTNATVHFDNTPVVNLLATGTAYSAGGGPDSDITPAGITLEIPPGRFAMGDWLNVVGYDSPGLIGQGTNESCLYSPKGCPSATVKFYLTPAPRVSGLRLEGNALDAGFGLALRNPRSLAPGGGITETSIDGYGGPGAISYGYQCDRGSIQNVVVAEAFSPAIEVNYSTNVWLADVGIVRTGLKRGNSPTWRQTYLVSWDSNSTGGGATNLTIDSSAMILGMAVSGCPNMELTNLHARNAVFLFQGSGNMVMQNAQFAFDSGAQEGLDGWAPISHPIVWVNAQQNSGETTLIENLQMQQSGYANSRHDILRGLVMQGIFNAAKVTGGDFSAPNFYGASAQGAAGVQIAGGFAWLEGFRVSGKAQYCNISADHGVVTNCWADVICVSPPAVAVGCWPDSNVAPTLPAIPTQAVEEGDLLQVSLAATDTNYPPQSLIYQLINGPSGAVVDPATGLFTWTPTTSQGPSTNHIKFVVTDNGSPPLSATNTFTVVVLEVNVAPVLPAIPTQTVNELTSLTVTNTANEANIHATLGYRLLGPPAGMAIDSRGVIAWTPQQSQSPSTNLITTVVTNSDPYDLINPHLSATNTFTIVVLEVNVPPVLRTITMQNANELTLLRVTNTAAEANIHSTLGYELVNPPAGMSIDASGIITWTPQQTESPSTNLIATLVTNSNPYDLVNPHLSATNTFTVIVKEVNVAPVLPVIPTQTVNELTLLTLTNTATESNIHSTLGYALVGPPAGMNIDANGIITWTPQQNQSPGTNLITTIVTNSNPYDLINPHVSATNKFTVIVKEMNVAPLLPVIPTQAVNELTLLTVTNTATESNIHSTLGYTLVNPPAGVSIAANGVFTWTPSEAQGPGTNVVTTVATSTNLLDWANPTLSATNSFTVVVNEVNTAPVLTVPASQTVNELATLSVSASATDSDIPINPLTFALVTAPTGMVINPSSGLITWTPSQSQSPSTNLIQVSVTDTNPPAVNAQSLSVTSSFTVVVREANLVPVLPVVAGQTVNELTLLTVTNTAAELNIHSTVGYALLNPPAGAGIDSQGVITWMPTEVQGPSTNVITTVATSTNFQDLANPTLSATNSFTVVVNEVNTAPVIGAVNDLTVNPGQTVGLAVPATDSDLPTNSLAFALLASPPGMTLDASNGWLAWRPTVAQANTTNLVDVQVTDDNPWAINAHQLSATQSFRITVKPLMPVTLQPLGYTNGSFRLSVSGPVGPDYILQRSSNLQDWLSLASNTPLALPLTLSDTNMAAFTNRFYRVLLGP